MHDVPSINQVALMGQIKAIREKPGNVFCWTFDLAIYREYGANDPNDAIEAEVKCGVGSGCHGDMIASANIGDWVTLNGKLRSGGFVQVRSLCVISQSPQQPPSQITPLQM
jgi:hypothetical protein